MRDRYNFVTPAKVQTLVVPFNECSKLDFERYFKLLMSAQEVRLLDVTPEPGLQHFNPQTFPKGSVLFDYVMYGPDTDSLFLHDFEPFRKTFVVLGVAKYQETENKTTEDIQTLKKLYPSSIVHNIIYFDTPQDVIDKKTHEENHSQSSIFYHDGSSRHNITAIETIICEVTRNFLVQLDNYATSYLSITLRSPIFISNSQVLTKTISKAEKRLSSGSSSFKMTFQATSSTAIPPAADSKYKSSQKYQGRQSKLMGNFYLLAGKYTNALEKLIEACCILKSNEDYLWIGSALESISVCIILMASNGITFSFSNDFVHHVLELSKSKNMVSSLTSSNTGDSATKRLSTESVQSSHIGSLSEAATKKDSSSSPRNSLSTFRIFNSTSSNMDLNLNSWPLLEIQKLLFSKTLRFYDLSTNDYENAVPDLVYVEFLLRSIHFMAIIYNHSSNTESNLLESIKFGELITTSGSAREESLDHSYYLKSYILSSINCVFSLQLIDLSLLDQCSIYACLASIYNDLGLQRKRAFILRVLLVGLLSRLEKEAAQNSNYDGSSSKGAVSSALGENILRVRSVLNAIFDVYGINLRSESSLNAAFEKGRSSWISLQLTVLKLAIQVSEAIDDKEYLMKLYCLVLNRYLHCLTTDDQLKLRDKISILSSQHGLLLPYWDPFLVRNIKIIGSKNKEDISIVPDDDKNIEQDNLIVNADETNLKDVKDEANSKDPFIFNPYRSRRKSLLGKEKILVEGETYLLKFLLQNPYAFDIELLDLTIVTQDSFKIETLKDQIVLLGSNQFAFQNDSLSNITTSRSNLGNRSRLGSNSMINLKPFSSQFGSFTSKSSEFPRVLPLSPKSVQLIVLPFKPLDVGKLVISGLRVTVKGCKPQLFRVAEREFLQGLTKNKLVGLENIRDSSALNLSLLSLSLEENLIEERANLKQLKLAVFPLQPNMVVTNILITNGWLMLLEGETFEFTITLRNQSSKLINYLSFSFWDSTLDMLSKKLSHASGLLPSDVYDLEWLLLNDRPFRVLNKDIIVKKHKSIKPYEDIVIRYSVNGKRGMNELKLILEYSNRNVGDSLSIIKSVQVPLNFTVYPSIEIVGLDTFLITHLFLQALKSSNDENKFLAHPVISEILKVLNTLVTSQNDEFDYCLLLVDFKNSWNEDLFLDLDCKTSESYVYKTKDMIPANKSKRIILPVERMFSKDISHEPIPSLRNKQFIKNYNISEAEEKSRREHFWLRQTIINKLKGRWKTTPQNGSEERNGNVDFRKLLLDQKTISSLIYPLVQINNTVFTEDGEDLCIAERTSSHFMLKIHQFYTLRTSIKNNSDNCVKGTLFHVPYPVISVLGSNLVSAHAQNHSLRGNLSIERRIFINGLQHISIGPKGIPPGESMDIDVSFVVIERGEYEWGSVMELNNLKIVSKEPILIMAK